MDCDDARKSVLLEYPYAFSVTANGDWYICVALPTIIDTLGAGATEQAAWAHAAERLKRKEDSHG